MDCYGTTIILTIHCSLSSSMNNQVLHRDTTDTSLSPSWPGKAWCAYQHWAAPPHVFVDDFHGFGLGSQMCFPGLFLGGGFDHLEKYESQWEGLSHIMKWKKVWNHQPGFFMAGFPPDMVIGYPNQICYIMGKLMKRSMVSPLPKQDVGEHQRWDCRMLVKPCQLIAVVLFKLLKTQHIDSGHRDFENPTPNPLLDSAVA